MGTAKADVDVCPECQAPNPWVYENDEYNCRHCGHVRTGSLAAKFRDEGEYVAPLTEVYLKNPAYRDKQQGSKSGPASAFVQKSEVSDSGLGLGYRTSLLTSPAQADLYRQIFGCVRNTLNLPELVAHRAYSILELVRKKHSKVRITPGVKHLAMCAALVAAREAGHQVSDLQISVSP
jgi:transcription initiation factor TFIIIB Brf1 subunit/transcription initiation factor TFIIB